ncbi:MAG: ammonium transporter [Chlorobiaceae bacterium]|nr:ammonium transporter [Chlorobiaceae bacterium]NTW73239.1 ammonium transporter [Chlorobiaceae bacterium]
MLKKFSASLLLVMAAMMVHGTGWAAEAVVTDTGTTSWMLTSTALVLLMVPGLAMFYGGLVRTKNVIGTMMHSFGAMVVIGVLWPMLGYSLSFGPSILGGLVGWDSKYFMLQGIDDTIMSTQIPEYVFAMFQGKFAIITPALIAGAFAERVNFKGYLVFIALWCILVYSPICHWVWAADGFLFNLGAMGAIDFAGGTVVHISSGVTALVAALYLGARRGYPRNVMHPSNLVMTLMGAGLLWVGWFGFNAGSAIASNLATARALTVTQMAAAAGAFTWMVVEFLHHGKATSLGVASGILAGLVAITPAAGVVQPLGAFALGAIAAVVCYLAIMLKGKLGYDDSLDAFGVHGIGGIVGAICLTFFIRPSWMADAATKVGGSWTVWQQLGVQATAVGVTIVYAAAVSLVLLFIVEKTIGLRISENDEMSGLDHSMHGEQGYGLINPN